MTKHEFIKTWNVAFEDKEQELEFAREMEADLELIKYPRLKTELLQFLEANNCFSLDPKQAEQVVDIYIKTYNE